MLTEALYWLSLGIAPIPVGYRSKKPLLSSWLEYQNRLPTEKEVRGWFEHRHRNLAIVTGWAGLTVIDFDCQTVYEMWLNWAQSQRSARSYALYTRRAITSRGIHIYVFLDEPTRCLNLAFCDGFKLEQFNPKEHDKAQLFNVKGKGGLCTTPPSVHPSGAVYKWLDPDAPILRAVSLDVVLGPIPKPQPIQFYTRPATIDPWESANRVIDKPTSQLLATAKTVSLLKFFPEAQSTRNGYFIARCPFHSPDDKASFWIDSQRNYCNCFTCGSGKPMDVIDLYSRLHKVDTGQAIAELSRL